MLKCIRIRMATSGSGSSSSSSSSSSSRAKSIQKKAALRPLRLGRPDVGCCGELAVATSCRDGISSSTPASSSGSGSSDPALACQCESLNSLPDEVLREILARVPLPALLPLRAVCRAWDRLILEDARAELVAGSLGASFLRAIRTRDGKMLALAYNPVLRLAGSGPVPLHASAVDFGHFIASAGSLLFYGNFNNCAPVCRITVSNPLSNAWRRLPLLADGPTLLSFPAFRRITVWSTGEVGGRGMYRILVMKFRCHFQTHIYCSMADAWRPCPSIPLCGYDFFTDLYTSTGPCVGGFAFYVVGSSIREVKSWSIWAFDLECEAWFNFSVPSGMLEGVVSYVLTECLGRLVLVARCGTVDWEKRCLHLDGVRLWELRLTRRRKGSAELGNTLAGHSWVKLGEMPSEFVPLYSFSFSRRHWWHPTLELKDCTVVSNCIFFVKGRSHGADAIVFDYIDKSWSVPDRDLVHPPRGSRMYEPGFCFIPNADIMP